MSLDPNLLKKVMAQWSSGITIVTTTLGGKWQGITANSCSSVSLNPPLVAVSIDKKLYIHLILEQSGIFAVNIPGVDQVQWGKLFARFFPDVQNRFEEIEFHTAIRGSPILPDIIGWVDCQVRHAYNAGDHTMFVGNVVAGDTPRDAVPLVNHNRTWGQFVNLPKD